MAILAILSDVACAGGTLVAGGRIPDWKSCDFTDMVGGDRGTCKIVLPADSKSVAACAIFNVIHIVDDDGGEYEYRIVGLTDGPDLETVTVDALDISHDLGRGGLGVTAGGVTRFAFDPGYLTPTQVIDTYVVPALAALGMSWIVRGTITPTTPVSLQFTNTTPLALLAQLESETKSEFWLQRNGATNYQIMLGSRTASGTPVAWVGKNVQSLQRHIIADERFFNRVFPSGATLAGETNPTGLYQNGWKVTAKPDASHLTIAHPSGGAPPIGMDDQLTGTYARAIFPIGSAQFSPMNGQPGAASFQRGAIGWGACYDPSRRTIYWIDDTLTPACSLQWYCFDDSTCGYIDVSTSTASTITGLIYSAARDRVYVGCYGGSLSNAAIIRVNPSTKAYIDKLDLTGFTNNQPDLSDLTANDQLGVGNSGDGVNDIWVIGLTAFTVAGKLPKTGASACKYCTWDSGTGKYFGFCATAAGGTIDCWTAAYAYSSTITTGFVGGDTCPVVANDGAGKIHLFESSNPARVRALTCSSLALGTIATTDNNAPQGTLNLSALASEPYRYRPTFDIINGKIFAQSQANGGSMYISNWMRALDPTNSYHDVANSAKLTTYRWIFYDSAKDMFACVNAHGIAHMFRGAGNGLSLKSSFDRWAISASPVATQILTTAARSGVDVAINSLIEIRADASDSYQQFLADVSSVAAYGPVDGFPMWPDVYKRNYFQNPQGATIAAGNNAPDGFGIRCRSDIVAYDRLRRYGPLQSLKSGAAAGIANRLLTGAIKTNVACANDTKVSVTLKGLPVGRVINPGDQFLWNEAISTSPQGWVYTGGTVNGSGEVTLGIRRAGTATMNANDVAQIIQPCADDYLGAAMVPLVSLGSGGTALLATAVAGLPTLAGATGAWVRIRLSVLHYGSAPLSLTPYVSHLYCYGYGNDSDLAVTSSVPAAGALSTSFSFDDIEIEQPLSLASANPDELLNILLAWCPTLISQAPFFTWIKSVEVYLADSTAAPPLTTLGAIPGDELLPWNAANVLLFTQLRGQPTIDYTVRWLEDDGNAPARVGQTAVLRDPPLGIAAGPRIISVARALRSRANEQGFPTVQLSTRTQSAMQSLANVGDATR